MYMYLPKLALQGDFPTPGGWGEVRGDHVEVRGDVDPTFQDQLPPGGHQEVQGDGTRELEGEGSLNNKTSIYMYMFVQCTCTNTVIYVYSMQIA